MRFWRRSEGRASDPAAPDPFNSQDARDATALALLQLMSHGSIPSRPDELAVVQAAIGFVGRSFAAATLSGPGARLLPATLRETVGRALMGRGEAVLVAGDGLALLPAASHDVRGEADPASWLYRCDLAGPSSVRSRALPASSVVHIRVNVDPSQPWRGRSAYAVARQTAETASHAEDTARREAAVAPLRVLRINGLHRDEQIEGLNKLFSSYARGGWKVAINERSNNLPEVAHVSPEPEEGHLILRREAAAELMEAMGVPSVLFHPRGEGVSQREALRRFLHTTLEPLARVAEEEIEAKTGLPLAFSFEPLFASDLQGRARALTALVKADVSLSDALATVGLLESQDRNV